MTDDAVHGGAPTPGRALRLRCALACAAAVAAALPYARVAGHGFLHYDDNEYVTGNPVVARGLSWEGVQWAFTTLHCANWHPLTWLSHMLDVQLFGLAAGAHHLVNVVLHGLASAVLFLALARMTAAPWRSALVAALFAVHPLHVESVAWVAERKDVLSTLFGFAGLWAYARYAERPGWSRYAVVAGSLALSLLAKPMWVTAPLLLLVLDVWPLRRVAGFTSDAEPATPAFPRTSPGRLVLEKLPLLALSLASAAITVVAQDRGGALDSLERLGLGSRAANALVAYAAYLGKTLWPSSLAAFYPQPPGGHPGWLVAGAAALLVTITALAARARRSMPYLLVGWLWFLGTLVPVIGLVQVGAQAMADRYAYVPVIGLFVAAAWGAERLARRASTGARAALAGAALAAVVALSLATFRQAGHWRDQVTLFRHALSVTRENGRAHHLLSQALAAEGAFGEAAVHAREAVRLDPENARTHKNLGYVLYRVGRVEEAIASLERAIALRPDYAEAHGNLAVAYGRVGRVEDAMREMSLEMKLRAAGAR